MTPHNLPQDWQITTIEESCIIKDNLRIPISAEERKKRNAVANKLYPYYGATGKAGEIDDYIFDEENVLLGEDGAPFLERKKDKAYLVCGKYWVNNHAHILQGKPNILDNKFLCHQLNIIDYSTYISGTTRLKLNQTQMKKIQIKLPPLEIQREIVEILESKLEKIKEVKALLETSLQECETYRLSLLESAFSGNLTPHSQDWQWVELKKLAKFKNGFAFKSDLFSEKGDPIIRIQNIQNETISLENLVYLNPLDYKQDLTKYIIQQNDILIAMSGATTGKIGIYNLPQTAYLNQRVGIIRIDSEILRKYIFYFLTTQSKKNLERSLGTAQPNLSTEQIQTMQIPLPPLEIQREIVEILESKLEKIKEAKALLETSLQECETYRLSLLESAFAGELV